MDRGGASSVAGTTRERVTPAGSTTPATARRRAPARGRMARGDASLAAAEADSPLGQRSPPAQLGAALAGRSTAGRYRATLHRHDQPVAVSAHPGQIPRRIRTVAERGTQQLDALAHGLGTDHAARPDLLHQRVDGGQIRCLAREGEEQVERQPGQRDFAPVALDAAPASINQQVTDPVTGWLRGRHVAAHAPCLRRPARDRPGARALRLLLTRRNETGTDSRRRRAGA